MFVVSRYADESSRVNETSFPLYLISSLALLILTMCQSW